MQISIHAFDAMTMFHLSTPLAVFGEVARLGLAKWRTAVFSDDGQPVRTGLGAQAASAVARRLVIAPHREGGQAQYIERPLDDEAVGEGPISAAMDWVMQHLAQPVTVQALAARVQMSPRNFSRRFQEHTGASPAKWVLTRRLDESRRLLETTQLPMWEVAEACGFASPVTFRQNFVTVYGTTPTTYRHHFSDV